MLENRNDLLSFQVILQLCRVNKWFVKFPEVRRKLLPLLHFTSRVQTGEAVAGNWWLEPAAVDMEDEFQRRQLIDRHIYTHKSLPGFRAYELALAMSHKVPVIQTDNWSTRRHFMHLWELVGRHRILRAFEPVSTGYVPQVKSVSEQASSDQLSLDSAP